MRGFLLGLSLSVAWIFGSATAQFVVRPAKAGAGPAKWEYRCFQEYHEARVAKKANGLGEAGWEMVVGSGSSSAGLVWCFKRPLP